MKPELEQNVLSYKYKGSSDSLYYKFFQSPLCDYLVTLLPMWLAPNVITLVGFMFNFVVLILMFALYGSTTEGPIDNWFCVVAAVAFFIATTLDNMDGK